MLISKKADCKPIFLRRGIKSEAAIKISTEGINQDKTVLNFLSKGDWAITASNEIWVMIFEKAAYKNKVISKPEISSTMRDCSRPGIAANFI